MLTKQTETVAEHALQEGARLPQLPRLGSWVPFSVGSAGRHNFTGELRFSLSLGVCKLQDEGLHILLEDHGAEGQALDSYGLPVEVLSLPKLFTRGEQFGDIAVGCR